MQGMKQTTHFQCILHDNEVNLIKYCAGHNQRENFSKEDDHMVSVDSSVIAGYPY